MFVAVFFLSARYYFAIISVSCRWGKACDGKNKMVADSRTVLLRSVDPQALQHGPKLLELFREAMRVRHYSNRTEDTYCAWVKRYVHFHNMRHPKEMGELEINAFLTHLAMKEKVSASTQNQALSALLFLYRNVARKPIHLPVVLTREEVKALLAQLTGDKWLMASLMYGAGLRLMECLRLRVQDIDFSRNEIMVRDGKGAKDRITMFA